MDRVIEISVDDSGCLFIPEVVRNELGISPGMSITVEDAENGGVRLCMTASRPVLIDKGGVWVIRAESSDDLTDIVRHECEQRLS